MKNYRIVICLLCFFSFCLNAEESFGYISYSSYNIGDDIQSIAAKRFLPDNSIPIDREFIGNFSHDAKVHTIVNGWFMHTKDFAWYLPETPPEKSWPPAPAIDPLLISLHITEGFETNAFSDESIAYFKAHSPVGARDLHTLRKLQEHGIPSYFSGCLTLTLENYALARQNIIYAVDVDNECVEYIRAHTDCRVVVLSHDVCKKQYPSLELRHQYAEAVLDKYRTAKCVITSKFHATMPCLAFETPVLLINTQYDQYRFDGIRELVRNCSKEEFLYGKVDFDFDEPEKNPPDYLPLRENLIKIVTAWVQGFKPNML